jgi:hypothetical protein
MRRVRISRGDDPRRRGRPKIVKGRNPLALQQQELPPPHETPEARPCLVPAHPTGRESRRLTTVQGQKDQDQDLALGELVPPAAQVLARGGAFGDSIVDPFPFEPQLDLRHGPHWANYG